MFLKRCGKRIFLIMVMVLLIPSFIFWSPTFAQDTSSQLERIKTQIHILNLLNGLELNRQQMRLVLSAAKEAQEVRFKAKETILEKEGITQTYQDVLGVAQRGSLVIPDNIAHRVHQVNQEVDRIREGAQEKLTTLALKVRDNLKPHQIYVLEDYKPCIIPPVQKGKIGQAEDHSGMVKILERIRSMPPNVYTLQRDVIAQKTLDKVKTKMPPAYFLDEETLKTKILKEMDDVRAMSDIDFAVKKEEIAKNMEARLHPGKPPMNIGVKIERFLLQPEIISILE